MDVTPWIDSDDLLDAHGVAEILGLAHRNTVSQYQRRYGDMSRPIVNLGGGRTKLWLRSEMAQWAEHQTATGRTRPGPPRVRVIRGAASSSALLSALWLAARARSRIL